MDEQLVKNKSIRELQSGLETGLFTSEELVKYYIGRINKYNKQLNAVITVNDHALEEARQKDNERKSGLAKGALFGIPLSLKDQIEVAGMPSTNGCLLFRDYYPAKDAILVQKLKAAGAIILCKNNLSELGLDGMGKSPLGGQTTNPFDSTRTAGGSSSGTAVSIAADFSAAGIGTDGINSVRSPSSACSVVGFRPTWKMISGDGMIPSKITQGSAGPITRTVEDAAILFDVILEDKSLNIMGEEDRINVRNHTYYERLENLNGVGIGLIRNFVADDRDVNNMISSAVSQLEQAGASVVDFDLPGLDMETLVRDYDMYEYGMYEIADLFLQSHNNMSVEDLIASGKLIDVMEERYKIAKTLRGELSYLEVAKRIIRKQELRKRIIEKMTELKLDTLMYPHQNQLVVKIDNPEGQAGRNGMLAAVTGFPAIVIPGGFSEITQEAPQGVPIGLEFYGLAYQERRLLSIADAADRILSAGKAPLLQ